MFQPIGRIQMRDGYGMMKGMDRGQTRQSGLGEEEEEYAYIEEFCFHFLCHSGLPSRTTLEELGPQFAKLLVEGVANDKFGPSRSEQWKFKLKILSRNPQDMPHGFK